MNELITITAANIGGQPVQTVNARHLHAFLEVGKVFAAWIQERIAQYKFAEGVDYLVSETGIQVPHQGGIRNTIQKDYHLTIDMAKELSMVERNQRGRQARLYFIECERRAKAAQPSIPQTLPEALRLAADLADQKAKAEAALAIAGPKADALDLLSASDEALTLTQAAKTLGVKVATLTAHMHSEGWIYRQNESWVAHQKHIHNGRLQYKEAHYTDQKTLQRCVRPYCHIFPKGLAVLAQHFSAKVPHEA